MLNTEQPIYDHIESHIQKGEEDIIKGIGNLNMDHVSKGTKIIRVG